jgi:filamentous hemagglutinin family protein
MRNPLTAGILLKSKQFGLFCVFAITATIASFPLAAKAQIAVDGSTATEVKGNVISPTGSGTANGGNLYNSFEKLNVPSTGVIFNTGNSSVDGAKVNNIINRVTGDTPSNILGTIESRQAFPNANLYLLNPNGVVFGANSRLDIGGSFHATTGTGLGFDQDKRFNVDKNSLSFPSGDPKNIQFAIAQPAAIINQGNLSVDAGKSISFSAGTVINTGTLTAPSGNVNLAAVSGNSQVELRSPDLVLGFSVNKNVIPATWNGAIATLPKLAESLTGKASQADQVVVKPDGTIALVANPSPSDVVVKDGMAIASGKIDVSSSTSQGGNVGIFGNQVGLVNSQIDASGATGGGTILIGGDLQGKGTVPNAWQTYVDSNSTILANGLLNGNGGKVIFWANDFTRFSGEISARGGLNGGDGGFVEVSGKQNLDFQGRVNTLAPNGVTGTLLLDPTDIIIGGTFDNGGGFTSGVFTPSAASANIQASAVVTQLGTNNVTISTASAFSAPLGGTITVNSLLNWSSNNSLTLNANNNIVVNANVTANGIGNFTAIAANNITVNASQLTTSAGALTLTATNGNINIPATIALGAFTTGNINFTAGNSITLGGAVLSTSGGNITLRAGNGGISVTNTNGINSTFPSGNSGFILIDTTGSLAVLNGVTSESSVGTGGAITIGSTLIPTTINISSINANGLVNGGNILLNGSLGLTTSTTFSTTGTTNGGNINLVNANVTGNQSLTLDAGNGNVSLGAIGTNAIPLIDLTITSGNTVLNKDIFVDKALNFNSPVTLNGNASVTTSSGDIFFNNTVNGNQSLTLSAGNNSIHFNDFVGGITPLASLSINTASTLTSLGNLDITALGNISTGAIATFGLSQPITITTAGNFNVNGKDISTASSDLTLTANQGFAALGNINTSGGTVAIATSSGNITSIANKTINTSSNDSNGGNISITANNGTLSLQDLNSNSSASLAIGNGGDIILRSLGNISVANINTSGTSLNDGNAGTVSIFQTSGNITLTGSNILLSALKGGPGLSGIGSSISFPNNVIISSPSLNINTIGFTGNGNVNFSTGLISSANSNLNIDTGSGNINFFGVAGTSAQPLGALTLISSGLKRFNSTVVLGSLASNGGTTEVNADIVATASAGISLGNALLNDNISLVGDEINFNGTATGTGNLTLKPFTVSQAIAIGGAGDTGLTTLDLTATDIAKFSGGTFSSLIIGNLSGTGAITLAGNANFAQPTTIQSPAGTGSFNSNGFDISGIGRLGIEVGDSINISNSTISPTTGTLDVRLNADRDGNGGTVTITNSSSINTGGSNITRPVGKQK